MVMTADGKNRFGNRMKANRYNKAHPAGEGPRAKAHEIEAQSGGPETGKQAEVPEHQPEGDMHAEIKNVVAEHGPAHEIHIAHDHEGQRSHVHSIHQTGQEHHAEHQGPEHVKLAHEHAMHAAGHNPEAEEEKEEEREEEAEHETSDEEPEEEFGE